MSNAVDEEIPLDSGTVPLPDWYYESIRECARSAFATFIFYALGLLYALLAKSSISDYEILANAPVTLPLLGAKVNLHSFIALTPIGLGLLFLYTQNYLTRLSTLFRTASVEYGGFERRRIIPSYFVLVSEGYDQGEKRFLYTITGMLVGYAFWMSPLPLTFQYLQLAIKTGNNTMAFAALAAWVIWIPILVSSWLMYQGFTLSEFVKWLRGDPVQLVVLVSLSWAFIYTPIEQLLEKAKSESGARELSISAPYFSAASFKHESLFLDISGIKLNHTNVTNSNFDSTRFSSCTIANSNFSSCSMRSCNFDKSNVRRSDFSQSEIKGSSLVGAEFLYVDMWYCNLDSCDLNQASLEQVDLRHASLLGAKHLTVSQLLRTASLYEAKLEPHMLDSILVFAPGLLEKPQLSGDRLFAIMPSKFKF